MLNVEMVSKTFTTVRAVDGISFSAKPGEIMGLIGPNGAGKSTTIRMIMNIIAPDSGSIRFNGVPLSEPLKNHIGYLPEERGLYKKVKVSEMLRYLGALKGMDKHAAKRAAETWLERFELSDWRDRKIEELSKGMAQKLQFIGTIIHDPDLVLFDEPFSGLDPVFQDLLLESILEMKERGKTILFSTHIMEHAEKICDRILLIQKGKEIASGSVAELKTRYGDNTVQIEYDGDASFLSELPFVESVDKRPRYVEIRLKPEASADSLLELIAGRLRIRRFELMSPSLHSIFIRLVGNKGENHE